ncbi:MAG: PIG-L family deacetylase [Candidatus Rokuibacteriota bacterium]|nr:MAG: PIG-L family deacetylase [Candidatus Rokubacteria bacterium]
MTTEQAEGDARTPGIPERGGSRGKSTREPPAPGRVLSIHAHPDDQEFTVAGTLAKWARAGSTVVTGYEDGMLEPSIALRRDLTRVIRRHRPDAVVCGDPTVRFYGGSYLNHPDHRVAADVTLDAVFPSSETRLIFPELLDEGLEPHKVQAVFIHGSERPDTFIDIADVLDVKLAALKQHKTQMGAWDPTEMITAWARQQGARRKLKAAESYRLMRLHQP